MSILPWLELRLRLASARLRRMMWRAAGSIIETVPPFALTTTRMGVIQVRIRVYWQAHARLPATLHELPALPGRDSATVDGWGQPIRYQITGQSMVTLSSWGADGAPGGTGPDQDIVVSFDASEHKLGGPEAGAP